MKIRLLFTPDDIWLVQSKRWWHFKWYDEKGFIGDDAYERAHFYARALKYPHTEEIE
jgi:hypothetical protein